jgi:uncharacterized protein
LATNAPRNQRPAHHDPGDQHTTKRSFHYRTKDKVEVDGVLENRQGQVVGIEVKASSTVTAKDFRGVRHLAERIGGDFIVGIVFYTGSQTLPFGPRLRAVPVSALWQA